MISLWDSAVVLSLVVWRVTSILYSESMADWLRKLLRIDQTGDDPARWLYPNNLIGEAFSCFWCLSLVVSLICSTVLTIGLRAGIINGILLWLASSAGAIVVEKWIGRSKARW